MEFYSSEYFLRLNRRLFPLGLPFALNKIKYCLGKVFAGKTEICTRCGDGGVDREVEKIRTICAVISALCAVVGLMLLVHYNHLLVRK